MDDLNNAVGDTGDLDIGPLDTRFRFWRRVSDTAIQRSVSCSGPAHSDFQARCYRRKWEGTK
jgi:hypothetical protein